MKNGKRIAGETDVIAIDQNGDIHILDFKTTRSTKRFDSRVSVTTGEESMPFFDDIATLDGKEGTRTYAAQYAMQLETYRLLVQQSLNKKVVSLDIIPFVLDYDDKDNIYLEQINDVEIKPLINLSNNPIIKQYISDVDNYLNQTEEKDAIDDDQIQGMLDQLSEKISDAKDALVNENASGVQIRLLD